MTPESKIKVNQVDKIEILTLQDNYVDLVAMDNSDIIKRASPVKDGYFRNSIISEHGFSAIIRTTTVNDTREMLFDFGFSESGAAVNAKFLNIDMKRIEILALSHGHMDHTGGLPALSDMIGKKDIDLVAHPFVFKQKRYLKMKDDRLIHLPSLMKEEVANLGINIVETKEALSLLDGDILFLGEIERQTDFEKGLPIAYSLEGGVEKWDPIEDDSSVVMNLKNKGLVVLSGCAHSGIINTVQYAKKLTGIDKVHAVMGGFHLTGSYFASIIDRTMDELKKIQPAYVIPTHCTGRQAIVAAELKFGPGFIMNMAGTELCFCA